MSANCAAMYSVARSPPRVPGPRPSSRSDARNLTCARMRSPEISVIWAVAARAVAARSMRFMLVAESFHDLGFADLTRQTQIPAVWSLGRELGAGGNLLAAAVAGAFALGFHTGDSSAARVLASGSFDGVRDTEV